MLHSETGVHALVAKVGVPLAAHGADHLHLVNELLAPAPRPHGVVHIKDIRPGYLRVTPKDDTMVYAIVRVDQISKKTSPVTGSNGWLEKFAFVVSNISVITIEIYRKRPFHLHNDGAVLIGSHQENISSMIGASGTASPGQVITVSRYLQRKDIPDRYHPFDSVQFTIELITTVGQTDPVANLKKSRNSFYNGMALSGAVLNIVDSGAAYEIFPEIIEQAWGPLIARLEKFLEITTAITEIHPFAKAAHVAIGGALKIVVKQMRRDISIEGLIQAMSDALSFLDEAEPLEKIQSHGIIMSKLAQQTEQCAKFIAQYFEDECFLKRAIKHAFAPTDDTISDFVTKFAALKSELQAHAIVHGEIVMLKMLDRVEGIDLDAHDQPFAEFPYAKGARYRRERCSLPLTSEHRAAAQEYQWLNNPTSTERVTLLLKQTRDNRTSEVAHSIAHHADHQHRLGSSILMDGLTGRNENDLENIVLSFFPTLARDLSDMDSKFRHSLLKAIRHNEALRYTHSIEEQFEQFILEPSQALATVGPIVIVIDAWSECDAFRQFVSVLTSRASELPYNFRIFIVCPIDSDHFPHILHATPPPRLTFLCSTTD